LQGCKTVTDVVPEAGWGASTKIEQLPGMIAEIIWELNGPPKEGEGLADGKQGTLRQCLVDILDGSSG
jgi:hypothetical protein